MTSISAFDLDHTLIRSNSSFLFFRHLVKCGFFRRFPNFRALLIVLEYHFCRLSLSEFHHKVFHSFLKGKKLALIESEIVRFLAADFYRFFYFPSFSRLRRAQHEGQCTVILSSSPSFIVGPIAQYLGVSIWKSSEYGVNQEGVLEKVDSVLSGEGKARYLEELAQVYNTPRDQITVYSDSALDLPFLLAAGKAVVPNPSSEMYKISRKKNWEII